MKLLQKQIGLFQKEILDWYNHNKRDLPWRHSRNPYAILISEVMAQQTQLSRVVPKYLVWMEKFPTIEKLAQAATQDILQYWSGLGYNRRALYLHRLAKQLVQRQPHPSPLPQGEGDQSALFPKTEKELRELPGVGEYTARALLCFAFDKQVAVVDTNVRKVILTFLKRQASSGKRKEELTNKEIQKIADALLPKGKAYEWNQALMDYASALLKHEKIPVPKQSHFRTSNRFYRGQVIRLLLQGKETIDSLFGKIENNGITKEKFEEILKRMEKEGLIFLKEKGIQLP